MSDGKHRRVYAYDKLAVPVQTSVEDQCAGHGVRYDPHYPARRQTCLSDVFNSLQMAFCLCLDMDGFYVANKFLVREIGWYAPLPDGEEAYGVQSFTHDYTWDMLSLKDQKTVAYVKRHITGLTFCPCPLEYTLSNHDVPSQDQVARYVETLWNHYKTPTCNRVAYKGGTHEFVLLKLLGIPSLDLEKEGCPTFNTLKGHYDFPSCSCHCRPRMHCAMSECYVFAKWFANKQTVE